MKLTDYPVWMKGFEGMMQGEVYLIPGRVAVAADAALDALPGALNLVCDKCQSRAGLIEDEKTGRTTCTKDPDCPIAIGWAAWDNYKEASRG
ncbi:hypothetical protein KKE60_04440 [Patescibacteria group bacterium]|nr:hypothetical protein [Patescibacteria group bacterium]